MLRLVVALALVAAAVPRCAANSTAYWLGRRAALIDGVYGHGPGVLPTRSVPDQMLSWPDSPHLEGLLWNMTTRFEITSTVFHSRVSPGKISPRGAFMFHHGHSDCVCPRGPADPPIAARKCRPGCNSSMPTGAEPADTGYSWWDLYNVSAFFHAQGYDVFILSMPLKGVNLGPGSTNTSVNGDHEWFEQWEKAGDHPLRYFLEPTYLTANYALAAGYSSVRMAGLSGGGWSTSMASAIDKRIVESFPIAGSQPVDFPLGRDYEQNPARPAIQACNYTCQYLLAGLEAGRSQLQISHEYDNCCFHTSGLHPKVLAYEANIRAELGAAGRSAAGHGWFTAAADNHTKHEVCPQDKTLIAAALRAKLAAGSPGWDELPCDMMHQPLPANCAQDTEPGLEPGPPPPMGPTPPSITHCATPPCVVVTDHCTASKSQQWRLEADKTLVHVSSGKCLAATAHANHAPLTLQACSAASATQQWRADSHSQWAVGAAGKGGEELCLNVGEPLFSPSSMLQLYEPCNDKTNYANQRFTLRKEDGTLRPDMPASGCVDVIAA